MDARSYSGVLLAVLSGQGRVGELPISVTLQCSDGMLSVLPGDELYPEDPDFDGSRTHDIRKLDLSVAEANRVYTERMNRMALYSKNDIHVFVTKH